MGVGAAQPDAPWPSVDGTWPAASELSAPSPVGCVQHSGEVLPILKTEDSEDTPFSLLSAGL